MRSRHQNTPIQEVDLIPMLTVMMGVLAFFVVITAALTVEQGVDLQLPADPENQRQVNDLPESLIIELDRTEQVLVEGNLTSVDALLLTVEQYLAQNPQGVVALKADPTLSYEAVIQLLGRLRAVGGDQVSLVINVQPPLEPEAE